MQQQSLDQGFRLDGIVVEPIEGALTRADGETVHLEPKVMQVLVTLAGQGNRTVARAEILDTVWNGQVAADELLTRAISEIRRALDDDPRHPSFIRTVPKRSYRLMGAVEPLVQRFEHGPALAGRSRFVRLPALVGIAAAGLLFSYFAIDRFANELPAPPDADDLREPAIASAPPPVSGRPQPLTSMEGSEWGPARSPSSAGARRAAAQISVSNGSTSRPTASGFC